MAVYEITDPVFKTTNVIKNPGEAYSDEKRKFQGISGIEISPEGRLWATWYGGGVTEDRYNYICLSTSGDGGKNWSGLKLVIDPDGDGPVRAFDPCLWLDPEGKLWFSWNQKLCNLQKEFTEEEERLWYLWAICTENPDDEDPVWSEPRILCESIMMNKPTVLSTGEWLICSGDWFWDWSSRVFRSTDKGKSWWHWGRAHVPLKEERSFDEHMVVERKDGSLWMLVRTKYGIGESFSFDKGRTWTYVTPSAIAHTSSRFYIRRLKSGNLLLVKHGTRVDEKTDKRSHLSAFISEDDGASWKGGLLLDERIGVSYPDGTQDRDGVIYITYDYARKDDKEIYLSKFTEEDILAGKITSNKSKLGLIINKATGINPQSNGRKDQWVGPDSSN